MDVALESSLTRIYGRALAEKAKHSLMRKDELTPRQARHPSNLRSCDKNASGLFPVGSPAKLADRINFGAA